MRMRSTPIALPLAIFVATVPLACTCGEPRGALRPTTPAPTLPLPSPSPVGVGNDTVHPPLVVPGEVGLYIALGDDVPPGIRARVLTLLAPAGAVLDDGLTFVPSGSRIISMGDTRFTLVDDAELTVDEGYVVRSGTAASPSGGDADDAGAAAAADVMVLSTDGAGRGVAYGAYAVLEMLGFAFLHPLAPTTPAPASASATVASRFDALVSEPAGVYVESAPRWPVRNWHLHTMHPLELTELLNGWGDASSLGVDDDDAWRAMLPEWDRFLEWLVANGQNEVEWVLLEADTWAQFAQSDVRQQRLRELVEHAHAFGVRAGADVPIALIQQHTFRLLREQHEDDLEAELAQIRARLDWLMAAGFDFVSTEAGSTEFTHPEPARMLAWMNEVARHVDEHWQGADARIKIHVSTGQVADGFVDPVDGAALDFNHLPHYADPRLGVMPHTVQHYGLDDPAPTYGNVDFAHVRAFLHREAGTRTVLWHPETAYWVSFDIDVPLFLPLYAERRLADLRLLARDEDAGLMNAGARMDGQSIFSSGWEWGYWLNDVVAARSAWDPLLDIADDRAALVRALRPLERALGPTAGPPVVSTLADAALEQRALLIFGDADVDGAGAGPADVTRRNGQAYLQGAEAFDDLLDAANDVLPDTIHAPTTQPDKLGLVEMLNPLHAPPGYSAEVAPLLASMQQRFSAHHDALAAMRAQVAPEALDLFDDIVDSARITALRATQVRALYDYSDGYWTESAAERAPHLEAARAALDEAALVVAAREARYRVPADRIAGWRENPTAYEFTYLWTVHSLYFWWRDEMKAAQTPVSPCVLNIINPADVALGEGGLTDAVRVLRDITEGGFLSDVAGCAAEPSQELQLPPPGLRP